MCELNVFSITGLRPLRRNEAFPREKGRHGGTRGEGSLPREEGQPDGGARMQVCGRIVTFLRSLLCSTYRGDMSQLLCMVTLVTVCTSNVLLYPLYRRVTSTVLLY